MPDNGKCQHPLRSLLLLCRVVLLDHHKTAIDDFNAQNNLPGNLEANFDLNLSGATIALEYFKPQVLLDSVLQPPAEADIVPSQQSFRF